MTKEERLYNELLDARRAKARATQELYAANSRVEAAKRKLEEAQDG